MAEKKLKYTDSEVTFAEVPEEITLCINISNCPCHCKGCHSPYLAEDIGEELNEESLDSLIANNRGITCVSFMGGDIDPCRVSELAAHVKETTDLLTCWYSGRDTIPRDIDVDNFDFIKIGHYEEELGGLDNKSTNQFFLKVNHNGYYEDITFKFQKNNE